MAKIKNISKRTTKTRNKAVPAAVMHDRQLLSQLLLAVFFLLLIIDAFLLVARWKMGIA